MSWILAFYHPTRLRALQGQTYTLHNFDPDFPDLPFIGWKRPSTSQERIRLALSAYTSLPDFVHPFISVDDDSDEEFEDDDEEEEPPYPSYRIDRWMGKL
ncbi:hypothetical protein D9615_010549 [Tricholomella constricta]|uniref:Uncharacterized protein n=1 Tax=Tricholomella constricta TaxID=117010 RepID=A0A8H5H5H4_9AGAR|nr:hypothetical protein D9615_010549 [Tricholomella constricta]